MLAIELALLTGRYVATAYNTRTESEWPPHPARLFSALVATHFADDDMAEDDRRAERRILEWLERQGAPSIGASEASQREVASVFVPVNDVALTDVDDEARAVEQLRVSLRAAELDGDAKAVRSLKGKLKKAEDTLQKAISRATAEPSKLANPRAGARLLPDYRPKQPRTFPSVTPDDPRVTYMWHHAAPSAAQRNQLSRILHRVVRLAHSSSLVSLRMIDEPGEPTWRPTEDGEETFRVVQTGQLAALERAFQQHQEIEPRVLPAVPQAYTRRRPDDVRALEQSVFGQDWLLFRRVRGTALPMTATAGVARALRKTLMSFADEPIPELLSGHLQAGEPSRRPHMAILPLPFVGHPHATGMLLGMAIVLPRDADDETRGSLYRAVARWEEQYREEDEDTPAVALHLGTAGELFLERVEWQKVQSSLHAETWCKAARVWRSVTPLALDRNPGDLRSRDPQKLAQAIEEAAGSVRLACERIGLPQPTRVEILPASPWAGASKARSYPAFPGLDGRSQRVLTHALLEFETAVRGPVILGAGRFVGLGLCRPDVSQ
jgi:CRISPR-associated protein Csb2